MDGCCDPGGYDTTFGDRFSRHLARRYRTRGLDPTATRMVQFLRDHGVEGATVLEVGGGVGAIQLELLRHGAARATNLELSDSYEAEAAALAADAGVAGRMSRRHLDLARRPEEVEPHDIVILHRVVCCYPDFDLLLKAAADHATRLLVFSHPPRNLVSRLALGCRNLQSRLQHSPFRTYAHDPGALTAAAAQGRLDVAFRHQGLIWHIVGLTAPAA
jgi:magnesium-protoporphyrin O-methyltransferase